LPLSYFIYKNNKHSYKILTVGFAEIGILYTYERAGVRVRDFLQDDAYIIFRIKKK
jgi:threonyl-tRNA synthetase